MDNHMYLIKKTSILVILCLSLCSCSNRRTNRIPTRVQKLKNLTVIPADAKPAYQISFKEDEVYGNTKKVLIGDIGGITVDDSGRVFITDYRKVTIDVFEPNGKFLTHIGRKGRGPGEFETVTPHIIGKRLYVFDSMAFRMNIFSLDSLRLVNTINMNITNQDKIPGLALYTIHHIYSIRGGNFIVRFGPAVIKQEPNSDYTFYRKFYFMNKRLIIRPHMIFRQKSLKLFTANLGGHFRFAGSPSQAIRGQALDAVSSDGSIFSAWSRDFLIKEWSPDGKYLHAIYFPYHRLKLTPINLKSYLSSINFLRGTATQKKKAIDDLESILNQNTLPKTWPALNKIKLDDQNRLWVSTIVKDQKVYKWWVLTQKGKLLARFTWLRNKPIKVIKNRYIYTQETDTTTGISNIVRYRIDMEPSKKRN